MDDSRIMLSYKQNKFNLLREQSEGYSKLTTEITASLGPPHSSSDGRPTESLSAIEDRARPVWAKIISLIGYFDLDPNRALDIILDIFSTHLTTHHTFFVALLSFSPWAGSYHHKESEAMSVDDESMSFEGKSLDEILRLCSPKSTFEGPSDNSPRILAQVLGFKFAYYCVSANSVPFQHLTISSSLPPPPKVLREISISLLHFSYIRTSSLWKTFILM